LAETGPAFRPELEGVSDRITERHRDARSGDGDTFGELIVRDHRSSLAAFDEGVVLT